LSTFPVRILIAGHGLLIERLEMAAQSLDEFMLVSQTVSTRLRGQHGAQERNIPVEKQAKAPVEPSVKGSSRIAPRQGQSA
jgi:hypothetical protein